MRCASPGREATRRCATWVPMPLPGTNNDPDGTGPITPQFFGVNPGRQARNHFSMAADPTDPEGLHDPIVYALLVDSAGTLWVGTKPAGLHRFDASRRRVKVADAPQVPGSTSLRIKLRLGKRSKFQV